MPSLILLGRVRATEREELNRLAKTKGNLTLTKEEIIQEIKSRKERSRKDLEESKHDIRTPGFNQDLGHHDALGELLEWIEDNGG